MAATESSSSWSPQAKAQPPPPIAQAPNPARVMVMSVCPKGTLVNVSLMPPMLGEPRFICPTAGTAGQARESAEWLQPGPLHAGQLALQPLVLTLLLGSAPVMLVGQVGPLEWVGLEVV